MNDVTWILSKIDSGDPNVAAQLLPLVYNQLRDLAAARLRNEVGGQTLQATALVHEAYLRLVGSSGQEKSWQNRGHFFAAAAEAMRRILVENARRKSRTRHGGTRSRLNLDVADFAVDEFHGELLELDTALSRLAADDPAAARLVELRYFAGLTIPDAAQTMGISPRSADRLWAYARAWLYQELYGN